MRASIQKIEQLESLQGEGGEALKDHFRRLHVPVIEAFHLLIRQYIEQLDTVKSNLLGFESSSAIVREEFLSGDIKNGLDRIATRATEDANEIESIRTSVSDILGLTPFSMDTVLGYVDRGKDHANETIKKLHALDEENEALMTQAESALQEVTNVVNHVSNWSSGGAILSADTLKEIDANLEELYTSLVTEAILMAPPTDEIDWIGQESAMYQQALPLEFLYTGAYANIPGGLESMGWYFMNRFPVSAMVNDEQAIQACAAPEIDHTVDEGGSWWNSMFNFFKGAGSGVVNAAGDAVEGVVNLVTDPVGVYNDTVEFIGAIVDDPALVGEIANELWNAFQDDMINGDAQSRGEWTGYALGLVGTAVVGDKGVSKVANASRMGNVGRIGGVPGYGTQHQLGLSLRTTQGMDHFRIGTSNGPALALVGNGNNRVMPPYNTLNTAQIRSDVGGIAQPNVNRVDGGTETRGTGQNKKQNDENLNTTSDGPKQYQYNSLNPGPLAEIPSQPIKNFYGGSYSMKVLEKDTILYRAGENGGLSIKGKEKNALGQWFTAEPAESIAKVRIDLAVKPQWIDPKTGVLTGTSTIDSVYKIRIPKGTTIYEGPVGSQGGAYVGGSNIEQIFIDQPWKLRGIEVLEEAPLK